MARGVKDPWVKLFQQTCLTDAARTNLPNWLRVSYLAYGTVAANGHALFGPAEIADTLGIGKNRVSEAIRVAIDYGHLEPGSVAACLRVPASKIGGGIGNQYAVCPVHDRLQAVEAARQVDAELELLLSTGNVPAEAEACSG